MPAKLLYFFIFPSALAVAQIPEGQHVALTATGKGVQIYACQAGNWVFQAPEAKLLDAEGREIGTHGAGPVWRFNDGRSVKGVVVEQENAPRATDIPWLMLKGDGSFSFIRRSDTHGGVAPAGRCEGDGTKRVPYTAKYTFYTP